MPKSDDSVGTLEIDLWASDETRQITLAPGIWVEIKEELDHGEEQAMQAAAMRGMTRQQLVNAAEAEDQETQDIYLLDAARLHFLKLAFYLVDWNFKDKQGRKQPLPTRLEDRIRTLKRLKNQWADRISKEIDDLRTEKAKALIDNDMDALPNPGVSPNGTASPSTEKLPSAATP